MRAKLSRASGTQGAIADQRCHKVVPPHDSRCGLVGRHSRCIEQTDSTIFVIVIVVSAFLLLGTFAMDVFAVAEPTVRRLPLVCVIRC